MILNRRARRVRAWFQTSGSVCLGWVDSRPIREDLGQAGAARWAVALKRCQMVICRRGRSSRVLSSVRAVIFGDWYTEWTTSRPFCGPFSRWQLGLYLFLVRCLLFCFFFFSSALLFVPGGPTPSLPCAAPPCFMGATSNGAKQQELDTRGPELGNSCRLVSHCRRSPLDSF